MKNIFLFSLIFLILVSNNLISQPTFEVNNIAYRMTSSNTVEVIEKTPKYEYYISIPSQVNMYGQLYSVTSIGDRAFENCINLSDVNIPSSVTRINSYAFRGCSNLYSFIIPNSISTMGTSTFENCSGLTSITISNSIKSIEAYTFAGCTSLSSISIPNSVSSINDEAFQGCSGLKTVILPSTLTNIGWGAFRGCSSLISMNVLNTISIPSSVLTIDNGAFQGCKSMSEIYIPENVTNIGVGVFVDCDNLRRIVVNTKNSKYLSIDSVLYSKDTTYILRCPPKKVGQFIIPSSVKIIGTEAFRGCSNLTAIKLPDSLLGINMFAFFGCTKLTSIAIPNIPEISGSVFSNCSSLVSIAIPKSVSIIGPAAFENCINLTSIEIPSLVSTIGNSAFENCYNITSITCNTQTPPKVYSETFLSVSKNIPLYVPIESIDLFKSAIGWKDFIVKGIEQDTIHSSLALELSESASSIFAQAIDTCIINFDVQLDSVKITNLTIINPYTALVEWSFWQGGIEKTFSNEITFENSGWNIIYQTVTCSDGKKKSVKSVTFVDAVNIVLTDNNELTQNDINILPNPATNIISISGLTNTQTIEIINSIGQVVYSLKMTEQINISNLEQGVYFVKVKTDNGTIVKKFIKQ